MGVCRFFHGSVDTPSTGVDTILQTQGKMMKKWSSGVDTGSSSCVDTLCSSVDTLRLELNFMKSSGHVAAWGSRGSA
ncbi:hypothetical protein Taro_051812 [Colocasia esculenta]|uniref:Uncharacterized protein n=1 Tax=Colocasia esculenta TaxID=4460 RepID=A0A843XI57_COLES|nr:hypothetical protein [Colocasia esculenta]